jgi:hypothetical protein
MDRDPLVTKFIHGPWADPIAHQAFVEARIRHVYPAGMGYWSIFASTQFIGWILLGRKRKNLLQIAACSDIFFIQGGSAERRWQTNSAGLAWAGDRDRMASCPRRLGSRLRDGSRAAGARPCAAHA